MHSIWFQDGNGLKQKRKLPKVIHSVRMEKFTIMLVCGQLAAGTWFSCSVTPLFRIHFHATVGWVWYSYHVLGCLWKGTMFFFFWCLKITPSSCPSNLICRREVTHFVNLENSYLSLFQCVYIISRIGDKKIQCCPA